MPNSYFQFKQFTIQQDRSAMKVTTDACLFGAWVAAKIQDRKFQHVLDIGAGTGLLSLMLAQKSPHAMIDCIEIDMDAWQQAKENISASPFGDRINVLQADARDFAFEKKYDLIISNPPFYENELKSQQPGKNVAHHGEQLSLSELFQLVSMNLDSNGIFFLLLPFKRHSELRELLLENSLTATELTFIRQSTKHGYFRVIIQGKINGQTNSETEINELAIWNDQQQYTNEFVNLLKDYYLHL